MARYLIYKQKNFDTFIVIPVPGTIQFANPSFLFKESVGCAQVKVDRANGCDGRIVAKWKTKDITAVGGRDYENTSGEIVFEHGELTKMIEINVKDDLVNKRLGKTNFLSANFHLTLITLYRLFCNLGI